VNSQRATDPDSLSRGTSPQHHAALPAHGPPEISSATPTQQHSCTRASTTARKSFSARKQLAELWSPLTAVPTSSSHGERRRYNSLCTVCRSLCRQTTSHKIVLLHLPVLWLSINQRGAQQRQLPLDRAQLSACKRWHTH
jgi:hypothetical protein